jgi:predicted metalloprotease
VRPAGAGADKRQQDQRVTRIEHVAALLASASSSASAWRTPAQRADFQSIVAAAHAVGDDELVAQCEAYVEKQDSASLLAAQRRCGKLVKDVEGAS